MADVGTWARRPDAKPLARRSRPRGLVSRIGRRCRHRRGSACDRQRRRGLGEDPAAWCGLVAVKPTAGLLPTARGTAEHAPLATTVADAALYLDVLTERRLALHNAIAMRPHDERPVRAVWTTSLGQPGVQRWLDEATVTVVHKAVRALAAGGVFDVEQAPEGAWLSDPAAAWHARRADPGAPPSAAIQRDTAVLDELLADGTILVCPTTPAGPHGHDGPGEHLSR